MQIYTTIAVATIFLPFSMIPNLAGAATITSGIYLETVSPNDIFPDDYRGSPALWKCDDVPDDGPGGCTSVNQVVDGYTYTDDNFTITFEYSKDDEGKEWIGGTWTFDVLGAPLTPSYLSIKAGSKAEMWDISGLTTGFWSTETTNLDGKGVSHLSFWDTGNMSAVPIPAGLPLLIGAIGAIGLAGRAGRRKRKVN